MEHPGLQMLVETKCMWENRHRSKWTANLHNTDSFVLPGVRYETVVEALGTFDVENVAEVRTAQQGGAVNGTPFDAPLSEPWSNLLYRWPLLIPIQLGVNQTADLVGFMAYANPRLVQSSSIHYYNLYKHAENKTIYANETADILTLFHIKAMDGRRNDWRLGSPDERLVRLAEKLQERLDEVADPYPGHSDHENHQNHRSAARCPTVAKKVG